VAAEDGTDPVTRQDAQDDPLAEEEDSEEEDSEEEEGQEEM